MNSKYKLTALIVTTIGTLAGCITMKGEFETHPELLNPVVPSLLVEELPLIANNDGVANLGLSLNPSLPTDSDKDQESNL